NGRNTTQRSSFLSSRSRHTRFSRDWSSDVCSSDLGHAWIPPFYRRSWTLPGRVGERSRVGAAVGDDRGHLPFQGAPRGDGEPAEIGRASCRERVESWVGGAA